MSESKNGARVMQQLGFAFLTWRRYRQRQIAPLGLTLKQLYVLRQLANREFLYPSEIADMLFCDRPTATVVIRNMQRQGWVERQPDPQNRKYVRISISEKGRARLVEIPQSVQEPGKGAFDPLACFSKAEIQELDRLLARLNNHLDKIKEEDGT